jgi:RNA polymerase sigma factor (TIGR02999 family)
VTVGLGNREADISALLGKLRGGDARALDELIPAVYAELRRLAGHYLRAERPDHTLQATALVHEAYLRMLRGGARDWTDRAHFLAVAARVMRGLLVDHARALKAKKRDAIAAGWDEPLTLAVARAPELLALDEALASLEGFDQRLARVVELKFYAGMSTAEIAEVTGTSERTVKREWSLARAWLGSRMREHGGADCGS